MADDTVTLILAWHDALNAARTDEVLALSAPNIRVGGPRGSAEGHEVLADWVRQAGIQLTPTVIHQGARALYVEQEARWPEHGDDVTSACTVFEVADGLVAAVLRYDTLEDALLAMSDTVNSEPWTAEQTPT